MASAALVADAPPPRVRLSQHPLAVPSVALLLIAAVQLVQVFRRAINWDEFWHYSQIHQLAAGTLGRPLQTLHTRLFGWVTSLPGTGVDHIVIIRLFMFGCEMVTTAAIVAIASRFSNRSTGLLCALAYLSFPYVFEHGYSFRFDPPAAALLMASLWILTYSRLNIATIALTGLLLGTAPMITIKIVLYAPVFAGVLWLRWSEMKFARTYLLRLAAIGAVSAAVFATIFLLHVQGQAGEPGAQTKTIISLSAGAMFGLKAMPYWGFAIAGMLMAPVTTLVIALVPFRLRRVERPIAERIALVGLLLPVTTLVFYHNTAPYYYAFMLPPVLVACSASMSWFTDRFGPAIAAAILLVMGLVNLLGDEPTPIDKQRTLLRAADEMFIAPVNYFDFCAFLGKFAKANGFLTPVVIDIYKAGGMSDMRSTMEREPVPLLVENDPMFTRLFAGEAAPEFLPQDAAALRDNFVHFWGPYWLAGKAIAGDGGVWQEEFLVPGPYTVRDAAVTVDGRTYHPDEIVYLERGVHVLQPVHGKAARLIWGERIREPAQPAPELPYWTAF